MTTLGMNIGRALPVLNCESHDVAEVFRVAAVQKMRVPDLFESHIRRWSALVVVVVDYIKV